MNESESQCHKDEDDLDKTTLTCYSCPISSSSSAGGGVMTTLQDPPPPAAADAAWHELQTRLSVENLCVASSHLLELIRTLRLSLLLQDEDTMMAEEEYQVLEDAKVAQEAQEAVVKLEAEWHELRNSI